jgi:hypothetical protein
LGVIPETLRWWSATPDGAAWLRRLPRLVGECAAAWELDVGDPLDGYAALEHYGGAVAPEVLEHDPQRRAPAPGHPFRALRDEAERWASASPAAGVDPERARGWAVAHALAWGCEQDGRWLPEMVAAARRLSGGRARGR